MKKLLVAATFAALAVSPALAQQSYQNTWRAPQPMTSPLGYAPAPYADPGMQYGMVSPYAAIEANTVVGHDPDANIRLQLKRDAILNEAIGF